MTTIQEQPRLFLCLHCGAGVHQQEYHKKYRLVLKDACLEANVEFKKTNCVRKAVLKATEYLENNELVNAGLNGSSLTMNGTIECDAGMLNVNEQRWSALSCISNVINPIKGVNQLYLKSKLPLSHGRISPIFLVGNSAELWCKQNNIPIYDKNNIFKINSNQQTLFNKYSKLLNSNNNHRNININPNISEMNHGTCGVIGYDIVSETMYVTTSSGGIWMKNPGRIGSSALIGCGFDGVYQQFNNNDKEIIGCCSSGSGEYLMQSRLSSQIVNNLKNNQNGDIMDEIILNNIYKKFKQNIQNTSNGSNISNICAGSLIMKINKKDTNTDIDVNWVHNAFSMGIGLSFGGQIKSYMSCNKKKGQNKIIISGRNYSIS